MKIVIDIPDEQIKKSLAESKYIHEDEGEKGSVHISMLYTNAQLEFVDVERKTDFYSCKYKILPKGHGRLIDADKLKPEAHYIREDGVAVYVPAVPIMKVVNAPTIIRADKAESEDKE